ncbi:hypothetical protein P43SY_009063 [Pythium insidiosum]|uniref:FYVE-type domain-containing protein n=1 Tax=Pythium insidiosum TaxID=114742 RepID=A0AAD5Q9W0_PYTIN|nr:hypothetical protein P43SY_009063 [Pythium insidiosum]
MSGDSDLTPLSMELTPVVERMRGVSVSSASHSVGVPTGVLLPTLEAADEEAALDTSSHRSSSAVLSAMERKALRERMAETDGRGSVTRSRDSTGRVLPDSLYDASSALQQAMDHHHHHHQQQHLSFAESDTDESSHLSPPDVEAAPPQQPERPHTLQQYQPMTTKIRGGFSHYKEGIRLAEMGDWSALLERIAREPQVAQHKDHHGMLPLHWACTENDVPPSVVAQLLQVFPEAVLTRNNAQYLPIHIAVRAGVCVETLRLLCVARPSSLLEETPSGKTALGLALETGLPEPSIALLRQELRAYEALDADDTDDDVSRDIEDTKRDIEVQSHLLRESMMFAYNPQRLLPGNATHDTISNNAHSIVYPAAPWRATEPGRGLGHLNNNNNNTNTTSALRSTTIQRRDKAAALLLDEESDPSHCCPSDEDPVDTRFTAVYSAVNRGQRAPTLPGRQPLLHTRATEGDMAAFNSGVCGVCYKKFSVFRKKYQCKMCWSFVCKKHVGGKVELPDHAKKRSVCVDCFIVHRHGVRANTLVPPMEPQSADSQEGSGHDDRRGADRSSNILVGRGTREQRAGSTGPALAARKSSGGQPTSFPQSSDLTTRDLRQTMPSRSSLRFGSLLSNSTLLTTAAQPTNGSGAQSSTGTGTANNKATRALLDRYGSDTTASLTDASDRNSAEVVALHHRIATLEEQNKLLLSRLADQEKQYDDCMLLLTQTMTRVAEIEMHLPSLRHGATSSERDTDSEINPASFDFGYPLPPVPSRPQA